MSPSELPSVLDSTKVSPLAHASRSGVLQEGDLGRQTWELASLADEHVSAGEWEGQPVTLSVASYPHHEIFRMKSGMVEMEDLDGTVRPIGPGQGAYLPKGWAGVWRTIEPTRMTYVILKELPDKRDLSGRSDWQCRDFF